MVAMAWEIKREKEKRSNGRQFRKQLPARIEDRGTYLNSYVRQGLYNINSFILWCPGFNFGRELSGKFDAHLLPAKKGQR